VRGLLRLVNREALSLFIGRTLRLASWGVSSALLLALLPGGVVRQLVGVSVVGAALLFAGAGHEPTRLDARWGPLKFSRSALSTHVQHAEFIWVVVCFLAAHRLCRGHGWLTALGTVALPLAFLAAVSWLLGRIVRVTGRWRDRRRARSSP
jgi:hypothetical protein